MISRVLKWGNSLAVRIPKAFASEMKVAEDSSIQMTMQEGVLQIAPVAGPVYELEGLLAGVTEENRHGDWETDQAVGKERW